MPVANAPPGMAFVPIAAKASPTVIGDDMKKSKGRYGDGGMQGAGGTSDGA